MFKRKIYEEMLRWKNEHAPQYALFLKGARRVGKTTLAQLLAKEYRSSILVRFDEAPGEVQKLFTESLLDLDTLFAALQLIYKTRLYRGESLIILDEIQLFPPARQALKKLLEDGRYHYLETGSLAGITKKSKDILIPSEEYAIDVLPMDFEEFLWARGDELTMPVLREHFAKKKPMGAMHQTIMKSFREYMLVGGMPQAVDAFISSGDFGKTDFVKQRIVSLYTADMTVQHEENAEYVTNFFERVPSELSQHNKQYVISHIEAGARIREYRGPIRWLEEAMIVNLANQVDEPSAAFNLSITDPSFKCYLMDTGLLVSLAFKGRSYLENDLYKAVLLDRLHVNEGMLLENVVAQCLRANGHKAFFYSERDKQTRKSVMEIDFLIRQGRKVAAVEVKSGKSDSIKSLLLFKKKFEPRVGESYVLHHGEVASKEGVWYLPYYMACVL